MQLLPLREDFPMISEGSEMKIKIIAVILAEIMLCGCSSAKLKNDSEDSSAALSGDISGTAGYDVTSDTKPFSEYTFEFRGTKENYMIIIGKGEFDDQIAVTVENNKYESSSFIITAPSGYEFVFPYSDDQASSVVNVITNDISDEYIPDIMQFVFHITEDELYNDPQNTDHTVSKMYTVDDNGELREISIVTDDAAETGEISEDATPDYLNKAILYHSEPDKFIYEMAVDDVNIYDDYGDLKPIGERVRIRTLTFDYSVLRLIEGTEVINEENPLYFGYAYWAAANSAAENFTMTTFNISDWENYIEKKNPFDGSSEYYFKIDDSRFSRVSDLRVYLETIFTPATALSILSDAPQKYCDINGELYGIAGDGGFNTSLGILTFSDMEISEDRMIFRSRQEKYNDEGKYTGYTDGGDFVISKQDDGSWRVSLYRYPYSFN